MKYFKLIVVVLLLVSCKKNKEFNVNAFQVNKGWGYTIAINEKIIIKQTVIPAISKQESFKSQEEALKVGDFVRNRIKQNLSPSVSKKDLILLEITL